MSHVIILCTIAFTGLIFFVLLYYWDRNEPEPFTNLLTCFFFGGVFVLLERLIFRTAICKLFYNDDLTAFIVTLNDEYSRLPEDINYAKWGLIFFAAFVVGALVKELTKLIAYEYATQKYYKDINQAKDPIVYALAIGLGFALGDILFHTYIDMAGYLTWKNIRLNFFWVYFRLLFTHLNSAIIIGIAYSMYKHHHETIRFLNIGLIELTDNHTYNKKITLVVGVLIAMLMHAVSVILFIKRGWWGIVLGVVFLLYIKYHLLKYLTKYEDAEHVLKTKLEEKSYALSEEAKKLIERLKKSEETIS